MEFLKQFTPAEREKILNTNQWEIEDQKIAHYVCKRQIILAFLSGKSRYMIMQDLQLSRKKMEAMVGKVRNELIEELRSEDQANHILARFEGLYAAAQRQNNLDLCYKILKELVNIKNVSVKGQLMVQQEWNIIDKEKDIPNDESESE